MADSLDSSQEDSSFHEGQNHELELKKRNVKEFVQIIKAVSFRETGTIDVNTNGIRIIVDDQHNEQAIAYLQTGLFECLLSSRPAVSFRVPLVPLCACLSVLEGTEASMKLTYDGYGEPLKVLVEHCGVVVEASVNTLSTLDILNFDFDAERVVARFIMKCQALRDAFRDMDPTAPCGIFTLSKDQFRFHTEGDFGKITTTIPVSSELIEVSECDSHCTYSYRILFLKRMMAALVIANKASMRIDERGVLSVQFMVDSSMHDQIFIEFYCVPDDYEYDSATEFRRRRLVRRDNGEMDEEDGEEPSSLDGHDGISRDAVHSDQSLLSSIF